MMKFYVVDIPEGLFSVPYQPLTDEVRVERSGWFGVEIDESDAEWHTLDEVMQLVCSTVGIDEFDLDSITVMDEMPSGSTLLEV